MWHIHPRTSDRPSPGDLGVFGELLDRASSTVFPVSSFVGLIVVNPDRDHRPPPAAWVVRHTGRHRDLVCERGEVKR
jgi:hypothetical protein